MPYLSYKLTPEAKAKLMQQFPPKYPIVKYDHITIQMCNPQAKIPPQAESVQITGMADDGNGLQVFLAKVNGSAIRSTDHLFWHITGSFDSSKLAPACFDFKVPLTNQKEKHYRPVTSNGFLLQLFDAHGNIKPNKNPQWTVQIFPNPIEIETIATMQWSSHELGNRQGGR